ncbi:50S ribosomal protein L3 N(5)-glutamine methyltransferase [Acidithiobacillus sp. AMEEHan]|uniref:50S ribosomal protein L3 N(5)-glutamine methyltransferase n=1 Tax=Acidithiobacillus sp. AMEEHan TaxID=2994951 RepID=UPI0027E5A0CC|nr:50S ribosomal protein L3 N(5)-glutamine methyltransferase [Acidithiobacillus sp. AMEEHan]
MRWQQYRELAAGLESIEDFWRYGQSRFSQAGIDCSQGYQTPRAEAAALIARRLALEPEDLPELRAARLTALEREAVLDAFYQREILRRPTAYILQEAWFAGLRFFVDERVLIPRSLLEPFIEEGFAPWVDEQRVHRILEIGTGSGCMAVALAQRFPEAQVDAVDISPAALAVAMRNIASHGLEERIRLLESDLFAALPGERYDLIVSNPPYVDAAAMAELPPEYRQEPHLALAAGDDGLACLLPLVQAAPAHLRPGGVLVLETGDAEEALLSQYPDLPLIWLEHPAGGYGACLLLADESAQ